jgi:hypothetical protein
MAIVLNVDIEYAGPGFYWLVGPQSYDEIALGPCYSETEVYDCVREIAISSGDDDDDWTGWHAARDWRDEPIDDLKINFDGPGNYVLEDTRGNRTDLGKCYSDAELRWALRRVVEDTAHLVNPGRHNARYEPEDWTGWTVYRIDK